MTHPHSDSAPAPELHSDPSTRDLERICERLRGELADMAGGRVLITGGINGDGSVDSTDLAILLAAWGGSEVDFNDDGICDSADLAILLAAWTG